VAGHFARPEGVTIDVLRLDRRAVPHVFDARSTIREVTPPLPTLEGTALALPESSQRLRPALPEPQADRPGVLPKTLVCPAWVSGLPCRSPRRDSGLLCLSPCLDSGLPVACGWSALGLRGPRGGDPRTLRSRFGDLGIASDGDGGGEGREAADDVGGEAADLLQGGRGLGAVAGLDLGRGMVGVVGEQGPRGVHGEVRAWEGPSV